MICPVCNRENDDSARFCAFCGASPVGDAKIVDEYGDVAVLAVDVKRISDITSKYPNDVVASLVEDCMDAFGRIVGSYGGIIVRRFGVGIEAVFGAPTVWENHAELAALAALNIIDDIRVVVRRNLVDKNDCLPVRCGIDFGDVQLRKSSSDISYSAGGATIIGANRISDLSSDDSVLLSKAARIQI
ncbi:MAG: zinc-ribbon domain-containing protein, partial [bacterium]|nr:zinc-ribbon domain-containing protein [bacterium]